MSSAGDGVISAIRSISARILRASSTRPQWTAASARNITPQSCSRGGGRGRRVEEPLQRGVRLGVATAGDVGEASGLLGTGEEVVQSPQGGAVVGFGGQLEGTVAVALQSADACLVDHRPGAPHRLAGVGGDASGPLRTQPTHGSSRRGRCGRHPACRGRGAAVRAGLAREAESRRGRGTRRPGPGRRPRARPSRGRASASGSVDGLDLDRGQAFDDDSSAQGSARRRRGLRCVGGRRESPVRLSVTAATRARRLGAGVGPPAAQSRTEQQVQREVGLPGLPPSVRPSAHSSMTRPASPGIPSLKISRSHSTRASVELGQRVVRSAAVTSRSTRSRDRARSRSPRPAAAVRPRRAESVVSSADRSRAADGGV